MCKCSFLLTSTSAAKCEELTKLLPSRLTSFVLTVLFVSLRAIISTIDHPAVSQTQSSVGENEPVVFPPLELESGADVLSVDKVSSRSCFLLSITQQQTVLLNFSGPCDPPRLLDYI